MAKTAWLLCLCMLLLPGLSVRAQTYALTAEPSADVLTLTFPGKAPSPATLRTGPRQVEMLFPAGTKLAPVPANPGRGRHVLGLGVADNVLAVQVAQEAFGFIASPQGDNALRLQVFYDPAGARWSPEGPTAPPAKAGQARTPRRPETNQAPPDQARTPGANAAKPTDQSASAQPGPQELAGAKAGPAAAGQTPQTPGNQTPTGQPGARVVRQRVDFSAAPAQTGPASAESATSTPPGPTAPSPAQDQTAETVSGPAQKLLAQGAANTPRGATQATGGPGPLAQRLRQAQPQVPQRSNDQAAPPTGARPQAAPANQAPDGTAAATPSRPQASPSAQAQKQAASPTPPQAQAQPTAQPQAPGPDTTRPQAGPVVSGKIALTPPPGAGQPPTGPTQTPQAGQTTAERAPSPPSASGQAPAAQTPRAGQGAPAAAGVPQTAPAETPRAPAAGQVQPPADSGRPAVQSAPDQGGRPQAKPPAAPVIKGKVASGEPPQGTPGPAGPAGQAQPQATPAPQGQGTSSPAPEQPGVKQGQPKQDAAKPAKPRDSGVHGAVKLTTDAPPPATKPEAQQAQGKQPGDGGASNQPQPGPAADNAGGAPLSDSGQTPAPQAASPEAGSSIDLGAPAKKPTQPRPEAFTLPGPGQEPAASDTLDDRAFLIEGEQSLARGDFDKAEGIFRTILANQAVSPFLHESALYDLADMLFTKHREHITDFYELIDNAYQEALNYNTTSRNIPRALINLGYLNLRMGNLPEAKAYFSLLKNKYPLDENVPLIDVYWGQYYLGQSKLGDQRENLTKAAQSFRSVLQNAPESKYAKDSALGLATTLLDLKQYQEASKVLDYVDKRWPHYYVENPSLRRVTADVAYKLGDYEKAKDQYLWFMNLVPGDETMDIVLARLGDVYARLDKRAVARQFYEMAIKRYPGSEGALMSLMRLAEQGVHDSPTTQEMFKTFASPQDVRPDQIYEMLVRDYPKSSIAPLALLKLAMWRLYKQEYPETLDRVQQFTTQYPGDELEKQAVEVGGQAFLKMLPTLMDDSNYKHVVDLWDKYPFLARNPNLLPSRDKLALALSRYYTGHPREALDRALPFLDQGPSEDAQKALALVLTIYRENQDWKAILDTLRKVSGWKLAENPRRVLQFAQAMALENTGDFAKSRLLWGRLAMDPQLDPAKRAYAMYYQARTAMDRGDNEKAAEWGQEARTLFEEAAKDPGKAKDALLLVIEAMQAGARFQEALQLCQEYAKTVPKDSPEGAANSFRMAKLYGALGDQENWRKTLENMRDSLGDSLYAKMAASELTTNRLEQRAGQLNPPPSK
ncbi:hypothetical protein JCM15519_11290 [Fundidesulfovibrio butyratiphilus]